MRDLRKLDSGFVWVPGRDFRAPIGADVFRRRTVEGSAVKGSIEGVGASTAYIEKASVWERIQATLTNQS